MTRRGNLALIPWQCLPFGQTCMDVECVDGLCLLASPSPHFWFDILMRNQLCLKFQCNLGFEGGWLARIVKSAQNNGIDLQYLLED